MRSILVPAAAVVALCATSCAAPPEVLFVEPNQVPAGEASAVRIYADGLTWEYNAFLDTAAATFEVEVGDTPLDDVTWIDATQLEATVPATLEAGLYPVTVRTEAGEDQLDDALQVRPQPSS